jgi:hypothetical protein
LHEEAKELKESKVPVAPMTKNKKSDNWKEEKVTPVAKPRSGGKLRPEKVLSSSPSPTHEEELNEAGNYSTTSEVILSEYLTVIQPEEVPPQDYSSSHSSRSCSSSSNGPEGLAPAATPTKKYVFDSSQGKIIEAHETKSQMDLVRDRILLSELDKQVEGLGVDPSVSAISYQEMSRALKHLKEGGGDRRGTEVNTLRKEVRQEVALNSLQRKVLPAPQAESGRLSNIFRMVKKSGSSWKHKVIIIIILINHTLFL